MNIWIMRHGEAGFNARTDSERTLTEYGYLMAEKQGQWLAQRLKLRRLLLDKILVSPYQRTQQTQQALINGMQAVNFEQNFASLVETWEGITPSGDPTNVKDYLEFLKEEGAKNVLIISHLPLVHDLVLALTHHQNTVHFYPAVIAEIDWTTANGRLTTIEKPSP